MLGQVIEIQLVQNLHLIKNIFTIIATMLIWLWHINFNVYIALFVKYTNENWYFFFPKLFVEYYI